jgi:hypothetical protein
VDLVLNRSLAASCPEAFPAIALVRAPIPVTCISLLCAQIALQLLDDGAHDRSSISLSPLICTCSFSLQFLFSQPAPWSLSPSCGSNSATILIRRLPPRAVLSRQVHLSYY